VLYSLNEDTVQLVLDIVENLVAINIYEELKKRLLLQSHTLDTHQSFEQLRAIPPFSDQWLSALLAAMLGYCPGGEELPTIFCRGCSESCGSSSCMRIS
jgi:hypothetical protein